MVAWSVGILNNRPQIRNLQPLPASDQRRKYPAGTRCSDRQRGEREWPGQPRKQPPGARFVAFSGATVALSGSFSNASGAYFEVGGGSNVTLPGSFTNAGTVSVSGRLAVGGSFSNSGTVQTYYGTVDVAGNYTQTAGLSSVYSGGTLASGSGSGLVSILGNILNGDGTV